VQEAPLVVYYLRMQLVQPLYKSTESLSVTYSTHLP
jgi:hypothetical protein